MKIPRKTLKNGFSLPVYGLGTWEMGGRMEKDSTNDSLVITAIQSAIKEGITHIDTAEVYANGYTETLIGKAILPFERKKLFLVSKVYENHMHYDDLIQACKNSLKRLQTSYLDLYLLHRYPNMQLAEAMSALDTLKKDGLIKHIGISNFTLEHLKKAQGYTKNKIVATQIHYNLAYREAEKSGVLKYCQDNDVMVIAWRPLQKGMLLTTNALLDTLCQKYKKTPAQIALHWLLSQKNVVTLSKTLNIHHLQENLGAIGWHMEEKDLKKLSYEFPNQKFISDTVPLQ
jgi:diketogulonate reductase-like aldo/keto reductase